MEKLSKTVIESNEDVALPKDVSALEEAYSIITDSLTLLTLSVDFINNDAVKEIVDAVKGERINNQAYVLNLLKVREQLPPTEELVVKERVTIYLENLTKLNESEEKILHYLIQNEASLAEELRTSLMISGSNEVASVLGELAKGIDASSESINSALAACQS